MLSLCEKSCTTNCALIKLIEEQLLQACIFSHWPIIFMSTFFDSLWFNFIITSSDVKSNLKCNYVIYDNFLSIQNLSCVNIVYGYLIIFHMNYKSKYFIFCKFNCLWIVFFHIDQSFLCQHSLTVCGSILSSLLVMSKATLNANMLFITIFFLFKISHVWT
jgi:hypothetical protein